MPRLRRVTCSAPGWARRRAGRGFVYLDENGHRITDPLIVGRIRALAIPPAWTDVWICPDPQGHLQAVGTDARGRRQYRYHDGFRAERDRVKFERVMAFAAALPRLRRRCARDLARPDLDRLRVLACAARLLDLGFFRVGGEGYAEENETYGLATMLKEHVRIEGDELVFEYPAKGGRERVQSVVDPVVREVITALKRRRSGSRELLAYRDAATRRWVDVRSSDINDYVKAATGGDFTAKDFRTWHATVLCAVALAVSSPASAKPTARVRAVARAVKEVAHYLGNTPAVCRKSYIDPRVIDRFEGGQTVAADLDRLATVDWYGQPSTHGAIETAVLGLLAEGEAEAAAA